MNIDSLNTILDVVIPFLEENNKMDLLQQIIEKMKTTVLLSKSENDAQWKEFLRFFNIVTGKLNKKEFYKKLFPTLRNFINSTNPQNSLSNVRNTSGEGPHRGGGVPNEDKEFRFKGKTGFFTYNNTENISLEDFMEQIFVIFKDRLYKYIAADDVAPTTGMIHYHLWFELYEEWDCKTARRTFSVVDDSGVRIYPNIASGKGKVEKIKYCAKKKRHITNMDLMYEINTRKWHGQLLGYELINKKKTFLQAIQEYPELLFKYKQTKDNLNAYFKDLEESLNPGKKLEKWEMFGIETFFSGKGKTPQYWIVGPTDVGKTENIKHLKNQGHKAYLMPKNTDWADWDDNSFDFMYSEETGADYSLTFLNQLLEGTEIKLNGKFVNNIKKEKNIPIILNSNHMPHMVYKNTDLYSLSPLLARTYIIYVDKTNYKGHIIWNPNTMTISDYANLFLNNPIDIMAYDLLFENKFENESISEKSYIRYKKEEEAQVPDLAEMPDEAEFFSDFSDGDNIDEHASSSNDDNTSSSIPNIRKRKNRPKKIKNKKKKKYNPNIGSSLSQLTQNVIFSDCSFECDFSEPESSAINNSGGSMLSKMAANVRFSDSSGDEEMVPVKSVKGLPSKQNMFNKWRTENKPSYRPNILFD